MEPLLTLLRRAAWLVLLMAPMAMAQDLLDVSAMLGSGTASVTNSAYDIGSAANVFDGNTNSLLRSAAVNPLLVTLTFDTPQPVNGFGVWFLAGNNEWKVEGASSLADLDGTTGSYRLLVPWRTNGQAMWNDAVTETDTVTVLRLSLHRLTGDNYVHLNEWRITVPDDWFRITAIHYNPWSQAVTLDWGSRAGSWYGIEESPDLASWTTVEYTHADGPFSTWQGTPAQPGNRGFWRVRPIAPEDRPSITKRVLVLNYDPVIESHGGQRLHQVLGWGDPVALTNQYLQDLHTSSHAYVDWQITEFRTLDEWPLKNDGFRYTDESYLACHAGTQPWHSPDGVNYNNMITTQGLDALVQAGEVDEVLVWGAPYFGYWESQMVGATAYWCNSGPIIHAGVPLYVIMGLNYERGVAEAIHSFGHRAESILSHVYGSWSPNGTINHTWDRFSRITALHGNSPAGCGNVHFPVNATSDYDYANPRLVLSEAEDWLNYPNLTGASQLLGREAWGGPDYHRNYLNWWYSRMPHAPGRAADGRLQNWWPYLVDMNEYSESR